VQIFSNTACNKLLILGLSLTTIACNERAQMGEQSLPRKDSVPSVIPAGFQNSLGADEFKDRSLGLQTTALTLNAPLEAAFLSDSQQPFEPSNSPSSEEFADACASLSLITGGVRRRDHIKQLSKQTALSLAPGETNCASLTQASGYGPFQAMNALRFLALQLASDEHTIRDCLSLSKKAAGRQAALSWNLSPVTGEGSWLDDKVLNQFDGSVEGGANALDTAFRSYVNIAAASTNDPSEIEKIHSSISAFIDSANGKTFLKKSEQHQNTSANGTTSQIRLSSIEFDFLNGQISETSTYRDLIDTNLVSEWKVSSIVTTVGNSLIMQLNAGGNDSEVEFSLDEKNALSCIVN
jgi:hypothetical protein